MLVNPDANISADLSLNGFLPAKPARATDLRRKLVELTAAALKIEEELVALESEGQLKLNAKTALATTRAPCTPAEKVALFLDLFGTRRSVYPKRWENEKSGKSGYSPACENEWRPGI